MPMAIQNLVFSIPVCIYWFTADKEPFAFVLEKEEVTTDHYVLSTLFDALCHCSNPTATEVEPEVFNAFNQTWQQVNKTWLQSHTHTGYFIKCIGAQCTQYTVIQQSHMQSCVRNGVTVVQSINHAFTILIYNHLPTNGNWTTIQGTFVTISTVCYGKSRSLTHVALLGWNKLLFSPHKLWM